MEKPDADFTSVLSPKSLPAQGPSARARLGLILTMALLVFPALVRAAVLQDFVANYRVEKYDNVIGLSTYQLKQAAGETHFSMRTKVSGLVALFRDDRAEEDSWLVAKDHALQLQRYSYHQYGSKDNRSTELAITWSDDNASGTANGKHNGKPVSIPVESDVRDTLSFQLSLMQNMASNGNLDFAVLSKDELTEYHFKRVGTEQLEINNQSVATTIVERQQKERTTRLWLADKFQYTPVKIEQFKDGKSDTRMLLNDLTLAGKKVL